MHTEQIKALASLARLHFEPEELKAFAQEFDKTLAFVNQLAGLDTCDVPASEGGVLFTPQREDDLIESFSPEKALHNAPQTDGIGFLIPKVL
jgi:aspartyl-tRNA(Asn)/glutamyl-tRNA(Gln) amidotransferase subunit C